MSTARTRTRQTIAPGGGTYTRGTSVYSTNLDAVVGYDSCSDVIDNRQGENPLTIRHERRSYFVLNGDNKKVGDAFRGYSNFRTTDYGVSEGDFPALNLSSLATRAAAGTNPGRPKVNMPVFIWELRELPGLIRLAGRSILGKIASGYLSWNFGWRPLINDLLELISLQETIDKRLRELRKLKANGILRRRLQLDSSTVEYLTKRFYDTGAADLYCSVKSHCTRKVWGSTRWKMSSPTSIPSTHQGQYDLARRAVLGLTLGNITLALWEALPWTWMIDWFTDIGTFFKATNNSIAYLLNGSACIMVTTTTTQVIEPAYPPTGWVKYQVHGGTFVAKRRYVQSIAPFSTSMPILSLGQLATAAALATQRLDAYAHLRRK